MSRSHATTRTRFQMLARVIVTLIAGLGLTMGMANSASADVSWVGIKQGADWGELDENGHATICDNEADGRAAYIYVKTEWSESYTITDSNGSSSGCTTKSTTWGWGIEYMKVCERINNWPDKCSDKVSITWGD